MQPARTPVGGLHHGEWVLPGAPCTVVGVGRGRQLRPQLMSSTQASKQMTAHGCRIRRPGSPTSTVRSLGIMRAASRPTGEHEDT
jgi:hypothetical protein